MKKIIFFSALVVAAALAATSASAQIKWTPQQLEVWKTETTVAALVVKGDIRGAQQYLGDDLEIWSTDSPVPVPRSSVVKWQDFVTARGTKVLFLDIHESSSQACRIKIYQRRVRRRVVVRGADVWKRERRSL